MRATRKPWRVVVLDGYSGVVGGAHVVTRDIALAGQALSAWSTTVILPAEGPAADWFRTSGVDVAVCPAGRFLNTFGGAWLGRVLPGLLALPSFWWALGRQVKGADIIHINDHRGLVLAGPMALLRHRRVVWHVHNADGVGKAGHLLSQFGHLAGVVLVPSPSGAGLPRSVLATAVSLPNAVHSVVPGSGTLAGSVVTVARLHPSKGIDVLLEAVQILQDQGVRLSVTVIGAAAPGFESYAAQLRQRADKLVGVRWAGAVADPSSLVASAELYVQPSRSEPFGLAVLEAAAMGIPAVVSNVGGLRDVVIDGQTGVLVDPDQPESLAREIASLLTDGARRLALGRAARERAGKDFTQEVFAARLESVYRSIMGSRL